MMNRLVVFAVLALVLGLGSVGVAEAQSLAESAATIDRAWEQRDGERVVAGYISRTLRMPVPALRAQRQSTGLGWGDVLIANYIAQAAKLSFEQVVSDFQGGKTWEDIAKARRVDMKTLIGNVHTAATAVVQRSDDRPPPSGPIPTR